MAKREQTISEVASLGGHARAAKLTPERRSTIAKKAAKARWAKLKSAKAKLLRGDR